MFPLRTSHVHHHVQRNYLRRLSAGELRVKVQRVTRYFSGETLPVPTDEVKDAWNDLPNATADDIKSSMSWKTKTAFPRAPPPTPTGLTFVIGPSDHPLNGSTTQESLHLTEGSVGLYDIDSPTPDVVAFQAIPEFSEEANSGYGPSDHPDRASCCTQEELGSSESSTAASERGSAPISRQESPAPPEFLDTVNHWISVYRAQGTECFIDGVIQSATESPESVPRMCCVAHTVIQKVNRMSNLEARGLENALRFSALAVFKVYWAPDGTWADVSSTSTTAISLTLRGINLAGCMGGLFDAGISTAKDIQLCLAMLLEGNKHVDRLCAMHALLVQANDKLCKNRNRPNLMQFRDEITSRDPDSGEFVWMTSPHSKAIIDDILSRIEEWKTSQAAKRERLRSSAYKRTIPRKAVGPRLRSGAEHGSLI